MKKKKLKEKLIRSELKKAEYASDLYMYFCEDSTPIKKATIEAKYRTLIMVEKMIFNGDQTI